MKLISRHIEKTVLQTIAIIVVMLAGLELFIIFANELDDIGKGDYTVFSAFFYALMQVPFQVYLFLPIASLLGCLLGLGLLANHNELIIFRASGVSISRIILMVTKVAFLLIFLMAILGEFIIPKLLKISENYKDTLIHQRKVARTPQGLWLHQKQSFIHIEQVKSKNELRGIYQYQFDNKGQLTEAIYAPKATLHKGQWQLVDVKKTEIFANHTMNATYSSLNWPITLPLALLKLESLSPDELNIQTLLHTIKVKKANHLNAEKEKFAFYSRIFQPLTIAVMMLLAVPFIFGPLRASTMGAKFLAGTTIGYGFYTFNKFFIRFAQVSQYPAFLSVLIPTLIFAAFGMWMLHRVR